MYLCHLISDKYIVLKLKICYDVNGSILCHKSNLKTHTCLFLTNIEQTCRYGKGAKSVGTRLYVDVVEVKLVID